MVGRDRAAAAPAEIDAVCPVWNVDMRALKIAGAAIAAVIVVIALLLVIGIPSGFLTSEIQERVERETGYKLTINGGTKIGLWPSLNVTLNDVTLQDPKDRDINNRLTAGSIQADVTLSSVWAGRPQITELVIVRPVLNVPLQRERVKEPNPAARPAAAAAQAILFRSSTSASPAAPSCFPICATGSRTGSRPSTPTSPSIAIARSECPAMRAAASSPLKFEIKAAAPAAPIERQNIPTELKLDAPGLFQAPLSAKAEVRLNGSVVMINGLTGTLGDGAFNGWASVDLASKPLVKLDLDFQRLIAGDVARPNRFGGAALEQRDDRPERPELCRRAGTHFRRRTQYRRRAFCAGRASTPRWRAAC